MKLESPAGQAGPLVQQVELHSFKLTYRLHPPKGSHAHSTTGPCSQMLIKPSKLWKEREVCWSSPLSLPPPGLRKASKRRLCLTGRPSYSQSSGPGSGLNKKGLVWSTPRCQKIDTTAGSKHTSQGPSRTPREEEVSPNNQVCHSDPLRSPLLSCLSLLPFPV